MYVDASENHYDAPQLIANRDTGSGRCRKKYSIIGNIQLDELSCTPKYLQIADFILKEISNGNILAGDHIPSINELSSELDIARDTVERGYKRLKNIGVLGAIARRRFYIKQVEPNKPLRIFLLFNKLSVPKKIIYDSFVSTLNENAIVDFYIYNNNYHLFKRLLLSKREDYTHFVIIPHFLDGPQAASSLINGLPKEKLILLDKMTRGIDGDFGAAYENFENDIYTAMTEAAERLSKYSTIKLIFPSKGCYPQEIIGGLKRFCNDFGFRCKVVNNIAKEKISAGEVFINVTEEDLVPLTEEIIKANLKIGEQVGIISYNETPLKKIILNGITTISTDFHAMGVMAAQLVLSNSRNHMEVPFKLTLRGSL